MKKITFIAFTERGIDLALILQKEFPKSLVVTSHLSEKENVSVTDSVQDYVNANFQKCDGFCFIGALGICVRMIAPCLEDKQTDPAVICIDDHGLNVISVVGGHLGGANEFAGKTAAILGAHPIISTSSDLQDIWNLDLLSNHFGWATSYNTSLNEIISKFVNNKRTALLLEVKDEGTAWMEKTVPDFVSVFYHLDEIDLTRFELLIAVSYRKLETAIPTLLFHPKCLHLGTGCSKELDSTVFDTTIKRLIADNGYALEAVASFGSIDIKAEQKAYLDFASSNHLKFKVFSKEEIEKVVVPNPSQVVQSKIGVDGVSESTALLMSGNYRLLIEKQKVILPNGQKFTFALALHKEFERKASIAIIGAGPGAEELITVRGKNILEKADCVLYAGSLVPEEMTNWCKPGAVVRNSASMTLEEQIDVMQNHYSKGHSIVRLHSGDPCIYGAIQEQMSIFDELGMDYYIVPGISAFNAAAAALKSEFTIPEVVQSIIITRGEGKTPVPETENLSEMAKLKATLCLFLSVGIAKKVENQLLEHYPPETPMAVLYRLTWKDEEIWTGELKDLAKIVKESKKTRTVLIIVGTAIGARKNRSQLYHPEWKHIFRTKKKFKLN